MNIQQIYTGCLAQGAYYIESNGEALIIFDKIKLARTDETIAFIDYGKKLATLLMDKKS